MPRSFDHPSDGQETERLSTLLLRGARLSPGAAPSRGPEGSIPPAGSHDTSAHTHRRSTSSQHDRSAFRHPTRSDDLRRGPPRRLGPAASSSGLPEQLAGVARTDGRLGQVMTGSAGDRWNRFSPLEWRNKIGLASADAAGGADVPGDQGRGGMASGAVCEPSDRQFRRLARRTTNRRCS